jgi:hypothetical protein
MSSPLGPEPPQPVAASTQPTATAASVDRVVT